MKCYECGSYEATTTGDQAVKDLGSAFALTNNGPYGCYVSSVFLCKGDFHRDIHNDISCETRGSEMPPKRGLCRQQ